MSEVTNNLSEPSLEAQEAARAFYRFWQDHPPMDAFEIISKLLGDNVQRRQTGTYLSHHILRVGYSPTFNLASVQAELRARLDQVGWHVVTTGQVFEINGENVPLFGISPILVCEPPSVVYHATRQSVIDRIPQEGLLPSSPERCGTNYPDTEGRIHVCRKLVHNGSENDSAAWWRDELRRKDRFSDPNWGIVRIDLANVNVPFRIHQDIHSVSGLVIDNVDRIPGYYIKQMEP